MKGMEGGIQALGEKRMVRMIHKKHYDRVKTFLTDTKGKAVPEPPACDDAGLRLPVTMVVDADANDLIMQDEIFGPFWATVRRTRTSGRAARALVALPSMLVPCGCRATST